MAGVSGVTNEATSRDESGSFVSTDKLGTQETREQRAGSSGGSGSDSNRLADKAGTPSTTVPESEDPCENIRLLSPPGLNGSRPWDDWEDEGPDSPLSKAMLGNVVPPPGLGAGLRADGNLEATALPPWPMSHLATPFTIPGNLGQDTVLQATSLPCGDWKALFPHSFAGYDGYEQQEPAVIPHPSETSTADESCLAAEDHPAYSKEVESIQLASENEILAAENARLAMENEMLRNKYVGASWESPDMHSIGSPDLSAAYWPGFASPDGSPDMSWAANPYFPTPWGMMPMSHNQMAVWQMQMAGGMLPSSSRARTDSDVGLQMPRTRNGSASDMGRSRTLSDMNEAGMAGQEFGTGPYTTVMLRNLPNNYSRAMLLKLIDLEGFTGQYDFIYLPMDFKSHASLGYAFVNLINPEQATRFFETFEGFHRWVVPSQKVCSVNWSHPYQGIDAHIERYRNSPVMHEDVPDDYKPMVFHHETGERIVFPPPTKKLKVPRMRPGHEKTLLEEGAVDEE